MSAAMPPTPVGELTRASGLRDGGVAGDSGDKFERDALDVFIVNSLWIGELQKLRVGHDAVGMGSGWHLERIIVHDSLGQTYFFPSDQSIDTPGLKSSKKQIVRELVPLEKTAQVQRYMAPGEAPSPRTARPPAARAAAAGVAYSTKVALAVVLASSVTAACVS